MATAKKAKKKKPVKREMWRDVKLAAGVYQVSNTGKVRRTDTKQELRPFGDNRVCLHKSGKRVAQVKIDRLVKEAFPNARL